MQCITKGPSCQQRLGTIVHTIAVLGLVWLVMKGIVLESSGGWLACPPMLVAMGEGGQRKRRHLHRHKVSWPKTVVRRGICWSSQIARKYYLL